MNSSFPNVSLTREAAVPQLPGFRGAGSFVIQTDYKHFARFLPSAERTFGHFVTWTAIRQR